MYFSFISLLLGIIVWARCTGDYKVNEVNCRVKYSFQQQTLGFIISKTTLSFSPNCFGIFLAGVTMRKIAKLMVCRVTASVKAWSKVVN